MAVLYFVAGKLGLFLAVPPGYATVIWPPSGLALGFILLYGMSLWPGVFIGSFALNAVVSGGLSLEGLELSKCLVPAGIAVGSTLQALAGKLILEKSLDFPLELGKAKNFVKFYFIAGPLTCLIAASIGTACLFFGGVASAQNVFPTWINWWMGDTLGIFIFLPLMLLSSDWKKKILWNGNPLGRLSIIALLMLLVVLGLTFYSWKVMSETTYRQSHSDFETLVIENQKALQTRIESYKNALLGGAGFFLGSEFVSREEWDSYVSEMNIGKNFPGMNGLGYIAAPSPESVKSFVEQARKDGIPDFSIHPKTEGRPHFIIKYIAPALPNKKAVGLNIAFEDNRLKAATTARDTEQDTITAPVVLVQDSEKTPGFLLLHPVYRKEADLGSKKTGSMFSGFIYTPLIANKFLSNLTNAQGRDFNLTIYDENDAGMKEFIYSSKASKELSGGKSSFVIKKTIPVMGRNWSVSWESTHFYDELQTEFRPDLILVGGIFITFLLALLLMAVSAKTSNLETPQENHRMTVALPLLLFFLLASISLYFYKVIQNKEAESFKALLSEEAKKIEQLILLSLSEKSNSIKRIAQRWEIDSGTPYFEWAGDADNYVTQIPGLRAIEWIDPSYHIRWVVPEIDNRIAIGLNIASDENKKKELIAASNKEMVTITPPLNLVQGYKGFIMYAPIHLRGDFGGFIAAVFDVKDFLTATLRQEVGFNYEISLTYRGEKFYDNYSDTVMDGPEEEWAISSSFESNGGTWIMTLRPTWKNIRQNRSATPLLTLCFGLVIAALLALVMRYLLLTRHNLKRLAISEERTRLLINGTQGYAIYMLDVQGRVSSWNTGAQLMKGYTAEEIIGRHFSVFYTEEAVLNKEPERILGIATSVGKFKGQGPRVRKDGSRFIAAIELDALYDNDGRLIGFTKITHDITAEVEQERKLQELTHRFELATKSARIGVWDWNIETNTLIWDDVMIDLYGLDSSSFSGAYHAWENGVHPEDLAKARQDLEAAVSGKHKFDTFFRIIRPDQSIRYIKAIADCIRDNNGKAVKMIGVNWDITELKRLEKMKDEFIGLASHELKTPLTIIQGGVGILSSLKIGELNERQSKLVASILNTTKRLSRIIHDMLDISRLESGQISVKMAPMSPLRLLEEVIENFEKQAEEKSLRFERKIASDIPAEITADEDLVLQVLNNLSSNALRYAVSKIIIEAKQTDAGLLFSVSNDGPFLSSEEIGKLFQKFSQVNRQTGGSGYKGTGLGLAICKEIISKHQGRIWVESHENGLTSFKFILPAKNESHS